MNCMRRPILHALLALMSTACVPAVLKPVLSRPSAGSQDSVVILKGADNPLFAPLVDSFMSRFDGSVRIYNDVSKDSAASMTQTLRQERPSLVVCLGNESAEYARDAIRDLPVVFALVPAAQELGLIGLTNFMGVAVAPQPEMEFSQFMMVLPHMRRVVTFFEPASSQALVEQARQSLRGLGIELIAVPVTSPEDIKQKFAASTPGADAVWLLADPVAINEETFEYLRRSTMANRQPLLTSLSEHFSEAGALVSVSVDLGSVGSQIALLSHKVLHQGKRPNQIGVQPPLGVALALNLDTASRLGVEVSPQLLGMINHVYTTAER